MKTPINKNKAGANHNIIFLTEIVGLKIIDSPYFDIKKS